MKGLMAIFTSCFATARFSVLSTFPPCMPNDNIIMGHAGWGIRKALHENAVGVDLQNLLCRVKTDLNLQSTSPFVTRNQTHRSEHTLCISSEKACLEEHKKKHPDSSVNFPEFSKKCSERWKTMSAKEKLKFEDMTKSDKVRCDREMKNYVPPKGDKKGKKKDPSAPKRPPSAFFLFCSEHCPKIKSEYPGLSIEDTAKNWVTCGLNSQSCEQKVAKLKEKYVKNIAAYCAKGKSEAGKKGPPRPTGSKKKNEPEDEEEEEEEGDKDEEEMAVL
ncbi:High mobility group protein B2 [Tupaia chinensis]|uniref:High mobility group protein B2 n=1 Tax=Tupaia chinensis TaxID=246437 RepID=L9L875_TUPCH|nr:High mobility group protein B2 [Tupaia chinensis]